LAGRARWARIQVIPAGSLGQFNSVRQISRDHVAILAVLWCAAGSGSGGEESHVVALWPGQAGGASDHRLGEVIAVEAQ
jgi:hypothetical protein